MHFISGGTILSGVGGLGATAGHARQWVQATSCRAECSREDRWCKPTLGPLTRATPAFTRASGQADSMQNWNLARVQEGGGEGAEVGAPGPGAGPEERSAPGLPAGWGLLRPSARKLPRRRVNRVPRAPAGQAGSCKGRSHDGGVCVGGRGPYSPGPAASASAAPTAASAVHPAAGGL